PDPRVKEIAADCGRAKCVERRHPKRRRVRQHEVDEFDAEEERRAGGGQARVVMLDRRAGVGRACHARGNCAHPGKRAVNGKTLLSRPYLFTRASLISFRYSSDGVGAGGAFGCSFSKRFLISLMALTSMNTDRATIKKLIRLLMK